MLYSRSEQLELSKRLILEDAFDWALPQLSLESTCARAAAAALPGDLTRPHLQFIGGMDISFVKDDPINACACLVVLEFPSLEVREFSCNAVDCRVS